MSWGVDVVVLDAGINVLGRRRSRLGRRCKCLRGVDVVVWDAGISVLGRRRSRLGRRCKCLGAST